MRGPVSRVERHARNRSSRQRRVTQPPGRPPKTNSSSTRSRPIRSRTQAPASVATCAAEHRWIRACTLHRRPASARPGQRQARRDAARRRLADLDEGTEPLREPPMPHSGPRTRVRASTSALTCRPGRSGPLDSNTRARAKSSDADHTTMPAVATAPANSHSAVTPSLTERCDSLVGERDRRSQLQRGAGGGGCLHFFARSLMASASDVELTRESSRLACSKSRHLPALVARIR